MSIRSKRAPVEPGPGRVPVPPVAAGGPGPAVGQAAAPRRGRRGLIVAVLVVLLGGVIAYGGGSMLTAQQPVLALARDVPAGAAITDADLVAVQLPADPYLKPVAAAARAQVVGEVAQVPLFAGGLLTATQVGAGDGFTAGQQLVALAAKLGQMPASGVTPGRLVLIVPTAPPAGASGQQAAALGAPVAATVAQVSGRDAASGLTVVDVRVPAAAGPDLARLAAAGNFAIVLLPPGGGR